MRSGVRMRSNSILKQPDGKSLLTVTPGAQLTAENISLTNCQ